MTTILSVTKTNECSHDCGFIFHSLDCSLEGIPPGAWFCNMNCGFYLLFDPDKAGEVRFPDWYNYGIAYLEDARPTKKIFPKIDYKRGEL